MQGPWWIHRTVTIVALILDWNVGEDGSREMRARIALSYTLFVCRNRPVWETPVSTCSSNFFKFFWTSRSLCTRIGGEGMDADVSMTPSSRTV